MEIVKVLGIDPSLRNTGLAIVSYNSELPTNDPNAFSVSHCQVVTNPIAFKGTDAILNMLKLLEESAENPAYQEAQDVIVESPSIMFNKAWAAGTVSSLSHISGGAAVIFGLDRARLFRPIEWNRGKKKDVTHNNAVAYLGHPDLWGYKKRIKSEKFMEHILDAASMALWWIRNNYLEE